PFLFSQNDRESLKFEGLFFCDQLVESFFNMASKWHLLCGSGELAEQRRSKRFHDALSLAVVLFVVDQFRDQGSKKFLAILSSSCSARSQKGALAPEAKAQSVPTRVPMPVGSRHLPFAYRGRRRPI